MPDNRVVGVDRPKVDSALSEKLSKLPDPYTGKLARRLCANHLNNPYLHRDLMSAGADEAISLFNEFKQAAMYGYLPFTCTCGGEAYYNPHVNAFICQDCGFMWRSNGEPCINES